MIAKSEWDVAHFSPIANQEVSNHTFWEQHQHRNLDLQGEDSGTPEQITAYDNRKSHTRQSTLNVVKGTSEISECRLSLVAP